MTTPTPQIREVNILPRPRAKNEPQNDAENEDTVLCKMCNKGFVTETALSNHARVEHLDAYMAGEDFVVKKYVKPKRNYTEQEVLEMQAKTDELISTMEPLDIMNLASTDVSYVIIKSTGPQVKKRKKYELKYIKSKTPRATKTPSTRKQREVKAITGPFECLQQSAHGPQPCHRMFLSCCEYSAHYRDEHTRRRKAHRCQVCEKPLSGCEELDPFTCLVCGVSFQNENELFEHSQTAHVKIKPYQCTICQKRFTQQGGLHQHMRMHTGDRPFPCPYCSKAFTQKSGLDQHVRIHTKVKPYTCIICSKSFCQSVHLQQHMRTHTNVAPFQCGVCQKRFKQSSHLNYHIKYHDPSNMTDEQKELYTRLLKQISHVEVEVENEVEQVEVDVQYEFESCIVDESEVQFE